MIMSNLNTYSHQCSRLFQLAEAILNENRDRSTKEVPHMRYPQESKGDFSELDTGASDTAAHTEEIRSPASYVVCFVVGL